MCNSKGFSFFFVLYLFRYTLFLCIIFLFILRSISIHMHTISVLYGFFYLLDTLVGQRISSFRYVEQALLFEF